MSGCVEISYWLTGQVPGQQSEGTSNDNDSNTGGNTNDNSASRLTVRLTASNVTPTVGEEVVLTCSVVTGSNAGLTFTYEPMSTRLNVNAQTGRATFIVSEPDVGVAFMVRCFAANAMGDSATSDMVTIIATESTAPFPSRGG